MPGIPLTLDQALHGFTLGGAWILNKEHLIGSLEEGKKADIVVLDRNLFQQADNNVYELHQVQVRRTFLNGVPVYDMTGDAKESLDDELPESRGSIF